MRADDEQVGRRGIGKGWRIADADFDFLLRRHVKTPWPGQVATRLAAPQSGRSGSEQDSSQLWAEGSTVTASAV